MSPYIILIPFAIYFLIAMGMANWGAKTKLGFWGAFTLSMLLSPVVAAICIVLSPEADKPNEEDAAYT